MQSSTPGGFGRQCGVTQPPEQQSKQAGANIDDGEIVSGMHEIEAAATHQIGRQPGQGQIIRIIDTAHHDHQRPHRAIPRQLEHRKTLAIGSARTAFPQDQFPLLATQPVGCPGIVIEYQPDHHEHEPAGARNHKGHAPAGHCYHPSDSYGGNGRPEICPGSEDRCRKGSFAQRRPLPHGAHARRVGRRLADAQQDASN
jgi:hypothetical protein